MDFMSHLYGRNKNEIIKNKKGKIYQFNKSEDEKYIVTEYDVFKGIKVFYNDRHTSKITSNIYESKNYDKRYEINHCREGRFECILRDGTVTYMEAGDFAINPLNNRSKESFFPINHYHGVTFYITPSEFDDEIHNLEKMYGISYDLILRELCQNDKLFIQRSTPEIKHIFYEIYKVPEDVVIEYLKVKFQELFLYLKTIKNNEYYSERQYFLKSNIDIVKRINEYISNNFNKTLTYDELSEIFNIKITTMKNCYKSIFGETINETIIKNRLEKGAELLKNSSLTITEIAIEVGYTDHSKFSNAFKKKYNITPSEYKKLSEIAF
ncbi:AraC family transcriptional regulator [Peptoniphilus sp. MSJ-1]|uniref:AraC family transcriptional regulator n=1 Tax=Peptoniphilus ovalis TaxID=2841503 RepID=A0ABS6FIF6_9FIRM|nr:AraC family transcriptional regulator [Peptoniphilus ovalis]MBU5669967.1 AraC family transcriptional regulator [Peptoniphilus ovalis]